MISNRQYLIFEFLFFIFILISHNEFGSATGGSLSTGLSFQKLNVVTLIFQVLPKPCFLTFQVLNLLRVHHQKT